MKESKTKWKLGVYVILRCAQFYIFLCIHLLILLPAGLLGEWINEANLTVKVIGGLACLIYVLFFLPLVLYWTALKSGFMQGSDQREFQKLAR